MNTGSSPHYLTQFCNLPHQIIHTPTKPDSSAKSLLLLVPENQWHQLAVC